MTKVAERVLLSLITDTAGVTHFVREGVPPELLPTEAFREVVQWALDYYRDSRRAPTKLVCYERWGEDLFVDNSVELFEPDPEGLREPAASPEWALEELRASYARAQSGALSREFVTKVAEAPPEKRTAVFQEMTAKISQAAMALTPASSVSDMRTSAREILADYQARAAEGGQPRGMLLGLDMVDERTSGIHPGELAVIAGPEKMGKSWIVINSVYTEWCCKRPVGLWSLEMSIKAAQRRIACVALHLNGEELDQGCLPEAELRMLDEWVADEMEKSDTPLYVLSPPSAMRTPHAIIGQARAYGVESVAIDQLTFMRYPDVGRNDSKATEVGMILHDLHEMINGSRPLSCLLAHQINRKGTEHAEKTGRLESGHLADSAEVGRTADMAFALWASHDQRAAHRMGLQTIATRRFRPEDWELAWHPEVATFGVRGVMAA